MLATATIPDDVSRQYLDHAVLPPHWRSFPGQASLQSIGDRFAQQMQTCSLAVPSALAFTDCNYILNPAHPHFTRIIQHTAEPFHYDARLLQSAD